MQKPCLFCHSLIFQLVALLCEPRFAISLHFFCFEDWTANGFKLLTPPITLRLVLLISLMFNIFIITLYDIMDSLMCCSCSQLHKKTGQFGQASQLKVLFVCDSCHFHHKKVQDFVFASVSLLVCIDFRNFLAHQRHI